MKTIYLNLNHETTRKALLEREFKKAYIKEDEYEQYSSLWGRNITKTMLKALINKQKLVNTNDWYKYFYKIEKNKLAIYLSHTFLWEKIYNSYTNTATNTDINTDINIESNNKKSPYGEYNLILEDDVILPPGQLSKSEENKIIRLHDYIEHYLKSVPDDWDILFIGRSKYLYGKTVAPNILKAFPMSKHRPETNHGMFAYLIKTSSIPKLLKIMYPIPVYYQHIDWKLRAYYSKGINAYYLEKPLVMHNYKIESIREQGLSRQRYQQR
jgi:GR25 family glycosyltransferase involved in LPS biosynthesis